ncbi:MAG TPA: S9 family peptidase [Opitutaceae bacterium]|jgi:dipeptidyl aminopeptidase/acylaminoacyl peptidase
MTRLRFRLSAWTIVALGALVRPAPAGTFQIDDLFRIRRITDPQVSPDGRRIAFVVSDVHMSENNTSSCLWVVSAEGGEQPHQLTRTGRHDSHPRWSPDGRWIAFESDRDAGHQIWLLPVDGGESRRVTSLSTSAGQPTWSRDGRRLAFVSGVFAEFSTRGFAVSDSLNRSRLEAREKAKVRAHLETELLYRHWDTWTEGLRQHLFVMPITNGSPGEPYDATPGDRDAVPTSSTFDGGDEFGFAPDGGSLVHTAEPIPTRTDAWSTNLDLLAEDFGTGKTVPMTTNPAADGLPRFSPDGKTLAYRAQTRPGFESDRWQLWVLDLASGARRNLTADLDLTVDELAWAPDGKTIYVIVKEKASSSIYAVSVAGGAPARVWSGGTVAGLRVSPDGAWLYFAYNTLMRPSEIERLRIGTNELSPVTYMNAALMGSLTMAAPESVTVPGEGGTPIQMWVIKPPAFDPARKYPLVFLVHGGPQGDWEDGWSFRWNPELWAAQGYVVAAPNPRGSFGFGQAFTDEVSRDWGGRIYVDLMNCVDWLEKQPCVDGTRMAAAGASFGGYMMNWFEGHTKRFKALVTHDGTFNFDSMYGTTDELWFVERETGIPWETPDFEKFSPHKYAANFRTPDLVIQNELDYRVPIGEGEQVFTLLQRKGIPSKFLSFPDEGHWVLKPQNSELWHKTVFDWLATYLKH